MKKTIYNSLAAVVVTLCAATASAQIKTSYFMESALPRYDMNAAMTPGYGYVNLPLLPIGSMGINLSTNFASVDNFLYKVGGRDVTALHSGVSAKEFLRRLPSNPNLFVGLNYNLVGFGKYNKQHNYFWSVGLSVRAEVEAYLPKDLFKALKTLGNDTYKMSDLGVNADAFYQLALGFTMPIPNKNIVVGGRLKFLAGIGHIDASASALGLSITNEEVRASASGAFQGTMPAKKFAGVPNGKYKIGDMFDYDGFTGGMLAPTGYGASIDLGAEMKLFDKRLKLSLAVNDLGFIYWRAKNSLQGCVKDYAFSYKGYITGQKKWDTSDTGDVAVEKISNSGYAARLAATLNAGVEWNFWKNLLGLGVLSHIRFGHGTPQTELTLTATVRPAHWFTASLSHTMIHNKIGIFGFAVNFHPKGVNIFLGTDYVAARYAKFGKKDEFTWPRRAKSLNAHIGVAFTIGRAKPW